MFSTPSNTDNQAHSTDLLSIGQQCSHPLCFLVDFLPFKCQHCQKSFCQEHFKVDVHKCEAYDEMKHNRIAPSCEHDIHGHRLACLVLVILCRSAMQYPCFPQAGPRSEYSDGRTSRARMSHYNRQISFGKIGVLHTTLCSSDLQEGVIFSHCV